MKTSFRQLLRNTIKAEPPSKSPGEAAAAPASLIDAKTAPRAYQAERSTSAIATSKSAGEAELKMPDPKEKQHIPDGVDTEEGTHAPVIEILAQWRLIRQLIEGGHAIAEIVLPAGGEIILFQGGIYKSEDIHKQVQVSRWGWTLPVYTPLIGYIESKATTFEVPRNLLNEVETFRLRFSIGLDERLLNAQARFARQHGLNLEAIRWTQFESFFDIGDEINFRIVEAQTYDGNHIRADASGSTSGTQ